MKKSPQKQALQRKRDMMFIRGLILKWATKDPHKEEYEAFDEERTHKNPLKRLYVDKHQNRLALLANSMHLRWRVLLEPVFIGSNGKKYYRAGEMVIGCKLGKEGDEYFRNLALELFAESNMAHYQHTNVTIEVLGFGGDKIKDEDFAA